MSEDVRGIASTIKEIVEEGGQVHGSRLSAALKGRFPSFSPADFNSRSLREFIATHVTDVVVTGRSGMDVVYGLGGAASTVPLATAPLPAEVDFWRVWVSPNSPHALAVDRTGTEIRAISRREPVSSGQLRVDPVGVDAHREVAKAFLSNVPLPLQERLRAVLISSSETWWRDWLREIRGTGKLVEWNAFRRRQLEDLLAARLRDAGLTEVAAERVLELVRERHASAGPHPRRAPLGLYAPDDVAAIRRVVTEAAQHMSVSELRELRLPLGLVLDALAASASR